MDDITIANAECASFLKEHVGDSTINMVLTSPPYDGLRTYQNPDAFTFEKFTTIANELTRVLAPGGIIAWVVGDEVIKGSESGTSFKQALYFKEQCGLNLHDTMIYEKNSSSFPARRDGNRNTQIFEYLFIFSKKAPRHVSLLCDKVNMWAGWVSFSKATTRDKEGILHELKDKKPTPLFSPRTNIWRYSTGAGYSAKDTLASQHPAIFPLNLAIDNILQWSCERDVILDPFSGSGTTAIASLLTNRVFLGTELNDTFHRLSLDRIALYKDKPKITKESWEAQCIEENKKKAVMDFSKTVNSLGFTKEEVYKIVDKAFLCSKREELDT